jgi:hypothetical protein
MYPESMLSKMGLVPDSTLCQYQAKRPRVTTEAHISQLLSLGSRKPGLRTQDKLPGKQVQQEDAAASAQ